MTTQTSNVLSNAIYHTANKENEPLDKTPIISGISSGIKHRIGANFIVVQEEETKEESESFSVDMTNNYKNNEIEEIVMKNKGDEHFELEQLRNRIQKRIEKSRSNSLI